MDVNDTGEHPAGDRAALDRLRRWGGEELLEKLVPLLHEQYAMRMAAARAGVNTGDAPAVRRAAHSLRSSCGQLGALAVQQLCERVEVAAGQGDLTSALPLLDALEWEFSRYTAWLDAERSGGAHAHGRDDDPDR